MLSVSSLKTRHKMWLSVSLIGAVVLLSTYSAEGTDSKGPKVTDKVSSGIIAHRYLKHSLKGAVF